MRTTLTTTSFSCDRCGDKASYEHGTTYHQDWSEEWANLWPATISILNVPRGFPAVSDEPLTVCAKCLTDDERESLFRQRLAAEDIPY